MTHSRVHAPKRIPTNVQTPPDVCVLLIFTQLLWFSSDNGAQPYHEVPDDPNGGLSGNKKNMLEGGIRVPAIIEWPGVILPRTTWHPACAMDFFPTVAEVVGLPPSSMLQPQDGTSLVSLFDSEVGRRHKPIPMVFGGVGVLIDNDLKLIRWDRSLRWANSLYWRRVSNGTLPWIEDHVWQMTLLNITLDPDEERNLRGGVDPDMIITASRMEANLVDFFLSTNKSMFGHDYPERRVLTQPKDTVWCAYNAYKPYAAQIVRHHSYHTVKKSVQPVNGSTTVCTFDKTTLQPDGTARPQ